MHPPRRRWRRARRGIATIIGTVLLLALTIVAGALLWSFRFYTPPQAPNISWQVRSGSSQPAWGDPTDCQPWGTWTYPLTSSEKTNWANEWYDECYLTPTGNFSAINVSQIIISGVSPSNIPLNLIEFTFICNNASTAGGTTVLLQGTLDSMIWFPGISTTPAANAPSLGYCGNFDAGGYSGVAGLTPANGTLYNRLGMFFPLIAGSTVLDPGDTFILYIHNGGWPITFLCVAASVGLYAASDCPHGDAATPQLDYDDYHGAPPWCFSSINACDIYLTYIGQPQTRLAVIPVSSLAPPTSS